MTDQDGPPDITPRRASSRGDASRPRPSKAPTEARLHRIALAYLERFAASADMLRQVLMRWVDRAARAGLVAREEGAARVEVIVSRCVASGLVDDRAFARGRAETLLRRGKAPEMIRRALAAKGVDADEIDGTLEALSDTHADPGLHAAIRLAQRRRIGPFRTESSTELRAQHRARDLATLARSGHDYETARRVIDAESADDLSEA